MLPEHEAIAPEQPPPAREFALVEDEGDDAVPQAMVLRQRDGLRSRAKPLWILTTGLASEARP